MTYSRRQFGKMAMTSLPAASLALANPRMLFAAEKPNSRFNGVLVGVITPYSYHGMPGDAKSLLDYMCADGISGTEIQSPPVEEWAGAPAQPARGPGGPGGGPRPAGNGPAVGMERPKPTPEQLAATKARTEKMTAWRLATSPEKYVGFRKMYNDAGVSIYGFKLQLAMDMPDAEYDYAFLVTKALGATQLTMELPEDDALTDKIGKFATKHKVMVGYHAHLQAKPDTWDKAMSQSAYNGINLDIGHYTAAGNHDQLAFIKKNHARITSMHMKDRKYPENGGANMPWGEGNTPIKEALQLIKKEGYKFPATIELEYTPPAGSDSEKEIAKCLAYAKAALA